MSFDIGFDKRNSLKSVTSGFLHVSVLVPLCQEKDVLCQSVVQKGARVQEGQLIAQTAFSLQDSAAKIHSPIPGIARGVKKCTFPNGKSGDALEIALFGKFSHIGKKIHELQWKTLSEHNLLGKISANGVVNTFCMQEPRSLSTAILDLKKNDSNRIFVRLYDEEPLCAVDRVISVCEFEKIIFATEILEKIVCPKETVFAYAKTNLSLIEKLFALKNESENQSLQKKFNIKNAKFVSMNEKKFPCGTKREIASRYKKNMRLSKSARAICESSLFVDAQTLVALYDAVVLNIPSTRTNVYVFGDCLKASAVLKVCVGTSFESLAQSLGLEKKTIRKIIVNGRMNGFFVSSLSAPVTKYVKSIEFVSKREIVDYSKPYCTACGRCRAACRSKILPDMIFLHLTMHAQIPKNFLFVTQLCAECGLCNSVCPAKLPLFQCVKILKEKIEREKNKGNTA